MWKKVSGEDVWCCCKCGRSVADGVSFYRHRRTISGLFSSCKECWNTRCRRIYSENTEYYQEHHRKLHYGLTPEASKALLAAQKGLCPLCGKLLGSGRYAQHVDHDHITGEVRGILCGPCNRFLGWLEKYPDWTQKAERYLRKR